MVCDEFLARVGCRANSRALAEFGRARDRGTRSAGEATVISRGAVGRFPARMRQLTRQAAGKEGLSCFLVLTAFGVRIQQRDWRSLSAGSW